MKKKVLTISIFGFFLLLVVCLTVFFRLSGNLASPSNQPVGPAPEHLNAIDVTLKSESGSDLKGWFIPGRIDSVGIILMHGNGENRKAMVKRAEFLNSHGYSIFLFDFQAHGESKGKHKTFGYLESLDAQAAVRYMRSHPSIKKIGVIGISLGGAAALLSPDARSVDALVLEAVYPTFEEAASNRLKLHLGWIGPLFTKFLLLQAKPRIGVSLEDLRPIEKIGTIKAPLLLIAGSDDKRTTLSESKRLFSKAPEPKELWILNGAVHEDFHAYSPRYYEEKILSFFSKYLE